MNSIEKENAAVDTHMQSDEEVPDIKMEITDY
jgi:hypothetical protein